MDKVKTLRDVTSIPSDLSNEELARETSGRIYTVALIDEWLSELQARSDNFVAAMEPEEEEVDHVVRDV